MNNYIEHYIKEFQEVPSFEELYLYMQYFNHKKNSISDKVENYNPNHDPSSGRFSSGGGSNKSVQDKLGVKSIETSELASVLKGGKEKYIYDIKSDKYIIVKDVVPTKTFYSGDSPYPSKESTKKNIDKLSSAEKSAITGYTSEYGYGSYNEVNGYLRNPNNKKYSQETIDSANNITSALNKAKLGTNTYVYRGVSAESFENPKMQKAILDANRMIKNGTNRKDLKFLDTLASLKGATITDKAPTSTSPSGGGFFSNGEVKMTIKTKKSDKAMDITSLSRFGGSSITPAFMGVQQKESEVLYAPNTTFQITDVKVTSYGVNILMESTTKTGEIVNNKIENYSPRQPRGDDGKWTSKGKTSRYDNITPNEFHEKINKDYGEQASWSKEEQLTIAKYCGVNATVLNNYLYEAKGDINKLYSIDREDIERLDNCMKNKLKEDNTLYRGVGLDIEYKKGDIHKEYGFASTSFFEDKGVQFAKSAVATKRNAYPYLFKINAKKGQKGAIPDVADYSELRTGLRAVEAEYILPRGTTYKVKNIIDKGDYKEIEVDIL